MGGPVGQRQRGRRPGAGPVGGARLMWFQGAVSDEDRLDRRGARQVLRRSGEFLRPYRRLVVAAGVLVVIWTLTVLAGPALVRYAIDHGLRPGDAAELNKAVAAYVVVAIVSYGVYRAQILVVARVGEGFLRDLRVRVFDHLQSLSMSFYDREKAGVLVSRMTSDVDSLAELIQMGLLAFLSNGLLLVLSVAVLLAMSWQLALLCLVSLPLVILASVKFQRDSNRAYLTVRDRIGHNLSTLQEGITGVRVIQAFGREEVEVDRFSQSNRALFDAHMASVRISVWYLPIIEFAGIATTALVVGVGGLMVDRDALTLGTVAAFVLYLSNLFEPVQQLSQLFNTLQSAGAGLQKLYALLDTRSELPQRPGAVDLPGRGELRVEGVSFAYGARPAEGEAPDGEAGGRTGQAPHLVLRDVDLVVTPGEKLALVGPTGAGKSTLAKLCARLYDPGDGRVTFGGVDLRAATLGSLRERIVVVPQEGFLFSGTIRDNVRLARAGATDAEVERAMAAVGVLERFAALPEGLDTEVRERGSRLSAGERQLVSLARAALVDPAVLVLDEATSSLDPGTEALVEAAVDRLMAGRTVLVIAHRLSTAERADRVAVVADGRILEIGPHPELVELGGAYAALYRAWAGSHAG
ncbi:MAG: ABC transporter ATP-binding protein [Acidimicrobiales bacterium]|nr:ABC transporter ATP-binding protein [Acidimicrobiales bacterium]